MQKININEVSTKEVVPGFHGIFVHTDNITAAYWDIVAGSALPEHNHVNEQVMNLVEGEFEMELEGEVLKLYSGAVVVIPSYARHSGKAITHCKIIDIFHPVRDDYKF
ncbi:MAG: cupin domain-containing protein [Bacteroidales bacterium]|jgi:quercetin dioxygenase-like cupin family protein|nr:cupin domain-containing protein [Bacteroidales bacterium]